MKRKYGETLEEIIAYGDELAAKLDALENSEAREEELTAAIAKAEDALNAAAARLTKARRKASENFAAGIARELGDLGMAATKFEVSMEPQPITSKGADRDRFGRRNVADHAGDEVRARAHGSDPDHDL